jgi:hypothetical protein
VLGFVKRYFELLKSLENKSVEKNGCAIEKPSKGNVLKLAITSRLFRSASKARLSTGATILAYGRLFSPLKNGNPRPLPFFESLYLIE